MADKDEADWSALLDAMSKIKPDALTPAQEVELLLASRLDIFLAGPLNALARRDPTLAKRIRQTLTERLNAQDEPTQKREVAARWTDQK